MFKTYAIRSLLGLFFLASFVAAHAQIYSYPPSGGDNFSGTNWSVSTMSWGSGVTVGDTPHTTGGNTGDYRQSFLTFATTPRLRFAAGVVLALNTSSTVDPTTIVTTTFTTLTMTADLKSTGLSTMDWQSPLIYQNGKYYIGEPQQGTAPNNTWQNLVQGRTLGQFGLLDTTFGTVNYSLNPDFTSSNVMTFGYCLYGTFNNGVFTTCDCNIDNWQVQIYQS